MSVGSYQMRPYVEEFAMADSREREGDCIDVAGVPVRGSWDTGVAAPAVLIDAGDDAMIPILEAGIDGVNMCSRGQGPVQQIIALLSVRKYCGSVAATSAIKRKGLSVLSIRSGCARRWPR
jgi:hypothetical protein